MPIRIQSEVRKVYNGREYVMRPVGDQIEMDGVMYPSVTAVVRQIMGGDWTPRVVARTFLGLPAYDGPRQTRTRRIEHADGTADEVVEFKCSGKCRHEGCYEPADCKHGMCYKHCTRHAVGAYSDRKYPRSQKPHMGVEIEAVYSSPEHFRRGVGIDCHRDASLGTYGAEYKVLAESAKIIAAVTEVLDQIWRRRARVNRRCGLHVHLDRRQVSDERVNAMLGWAQRTQDVWYSLVPPSRRNSHYAAPINEYNRASHTTWMHTTPYRTVEVRIHSGTLNPHKIAGWLSAMIHLQAKMADEAFAFPDTGEAEADFWAVFEDCPAAGKEYLATRKACGGVIRDEAYASVED